MDTLPGLAVFAPASDRPPGDYVLFGMLKKVLVEVFNFGHSEAHKIAQAVDPVLDEFRSLLISEIRTLIADARLDEAAIAAIVSAELNKFLGSTPPPSADGEVTSL